MTTPDQPEPAPTPRSDARAVPASTGDADDYSPMFVPVELSRQLERENAELREVLDRLLGASARVGEEGYNFACEVTPWESARAILARTAQGKEQG